MKTRMRVIFFGTPKESVPALHALANDERFDVCAAVTQPARPVGRHATVTPSPVAAFAASKNILTLSPTRPEEELARMQSLHPDVCVLVAYGCIVSPAVVQLAPWGIVNIHPSLLPHWRGATPVPSAILAGDTQTGVSFMVLDDKMDHGPILEQVKTEIGEHEMGDELLMRLMRMGAERLGDVLVRYRDGEIQPIEQVDKNATYCKKLSREDARINWAQSAVSIERRIRAFHPWPGTWTEVFIDGAWKRLKILKAHVEDMHSASAPTLHCGDGQARVGALVIDTLQIEGKKPSSAATFARTRKNASFPLR